MVSLQVSFSTVTTTATVLITNRLPCRPHRFNVRCQSDNNEKNLGKLDRRNLLMGIGGLYGAATTISSNGSLEASAAPITSPDFSKCTTGTNLNTQQPLTENCCPPLSNEIIDYKLPPVTKMRVRPAAHLAGKDYWEKYKKAVALMKALPADDPRNFMQQANVHCAYCNLTYPQPGDEKVKLQIHNCWHFFPWHRWYLYFYERILGKLIDDPTFGLPYWNWDHPDGFALPEPFVEKGSSLYDARRDPNHLPPAQADLAYSAAKPTDPKQIKQNNLTVMYREMVRRVWKMEDFYGAKYVVGTKPDPGPGSVERGSHTALHAWVGENTDSGEDMGNFYSTARDTVFYSHHANVDRLWTVWRELRGNEQKDFSERDWLDADFLFYDEDARLVRVRVADTLEDKKMGFTYQKVDLPWLKNRPSAQNKKSKLAASTGIPVAEKAFPVKLNKTVKVLVTRPKKSRSQKEKGETEELLVIEGIEVDTSKFVKFDIFVNDEDDGANLDKAEYVGCYSQVPHKNSGKLKTMIRLGLTEVMEDLEAEDDDKILVSLVPRGSGGDISIGGVKIVYD